LERNENEEENKMIENIDGLKTCKCSGDSLSNKAHLTDVYGKSVEVLICPECSGQIEFNEEKEKW
jgi:predicted SprT family Zn-dependent metalloprotease